MGAINAFMVKGSLLYLEAAMQEEFLGFDNTRFHRGTVDSEFLDE